MTTSRLELLHAEALRLDESDPVQRDALELPKTTRHSYLTGNSLGPLPKQTRSSSPNSTTGVAWPSMHILKAQPWYDAHLVLANQRSTGCCHPHEVVWMNGLTVNLHLLPPAASQGKRTKILMDAPAFPSDTYASSHICVRGFDPDEHLIVVNSGTEEATAPEVLEAAIADAGTRWHWA